MPEIKSFSVSIPMVSEKGPIQPDVCFDELPDHGDIVEVDLPDGPAKVVFDSGWSKIPRFEDCPAGALRGRVVQRC